MLKLPSTLDSNKTGNISTEGHFVAGKWVISSRFLLEAEQAKQDFADNREWRKRVFEQGGTQCAGYRNKEQK